MEIGKGIAVVDGMVLDNVSLGQRVRLARITRGMRQLDLASVTGLNPGDVVNIEHDRPVHYWKLRRVLDTLEISVKP